MVLNENEIYMCGPILYFRVQRLLQVSRKMKFEVE